MRDHSSRSPVADEPQLRYKGKGIGDRLIGMEHVRKSSLDRYYTFRLKMERDPTKKGRMRTINYKDALPPGRPEAHQGLASKRGAGG